MARYLRLSPGLVSFRILWLPHGCHKRCQIRQQDRCRTTGTADLSKQSKTRVTRRTKGSENREVLPKPRAHVRYAGGTGFAGCCGSCGNSCGNTRSEERRVGKECRSRWSP